MFDMSDSGRPTFRSVQQMARALSGVTIVGNYRG